MEAHSLSAVKRGILWLFPDLADPEKITSSRNVECASISEPMKFGLECMPDPGFAAATTTLNDPRLSSMSILDNVFFTLRKAVKMQASERRAINTYRCIREAGDSGYCLVSNGKFMNVSDPPHHQEDAFS